MTAVPWDNSWRIAYCITARNREGRLFLNGISNVCYFFPLTLNLKSYEFASLLEVKVAFHYGSPAMPKWLLVYAFAIRSLPYFLMCFFPSSKAGATRAPVSSLACPAPEPASVPWTLSWWTVRCMWNHLLLGDFSTDTTYKLSYRLYISPSIFLYLTIILNKQAGV